MIFGRGGGGGVVNRVIKEAGFQPVRAVTLQAGAYEQQAGHRRPGSAAHRARSPFRVNGMFENSGSFRNGVAWSAPASTRRSRSRRGTQTKVTLGYEYLRRHARRRSRHDVVRRQAGGRGPSTRTTAIPANSHVRRERQYRLGARRTSIRGGQRSAEPDDGRRLRSLLPEFRARRGVTPDGSQVTLTAYNNATNRTNIFNQTDLTFLASTGACATRCWPVSRSVAS